MENSQKFTGDEVQRYLRHLDLEGVGPAGQRRLKEARVCVVGAGGLGSPVLLYLAAAGVGHIGVVDGDKVDLSNLQRQVIHSTPNVGKLKCISARERIEEVNPHVEVVCYDTFLTAANAEQILSGYDFVVEATDHFESKYLINDVCTRLQKPFSIGGVQQFSGQTITCLPGTKSYRDVFPEAEDNAECHSCQVLGILGVIPGVIGTIQATEVVKYILNIGTLLTDRLLIFDAKAMTFNILHV